ncbi:hypothetical protein [Acinetobacter haemolyticus]|uniref:hypothetical protein n=1 Tax=Acinetobacter haemolyticus TaxID=29430 RepID=UPI0009494C5C|nr:hypothetical protein [Acinetobacter haemolyticus]APR70721.1 hypothetical protein AHTJS_10285 [Acinetobacter haemolyticus]
MKKLILICLTTMIIGCQKQPEQTDMTASTQFEKADQKITEILDLLDNPNADKADQTRVLCVEYPKVYEQEYMPALLELSPNDYTKESLLNDLIVATDYYKERLDIQCS